MLDIKALLEEIEIQEELSSQTQAVDHLCYLLKMNNPASLYRWLKGELPSTRRFIDLLAIAKKYNVELLKETDDEF